MRSRRSDDAFRAAARRVYGDRGVHVDRNAVVERDADGGAFVHVTVYLSAREADNPEQAEALS